MKILRVITIIAAALAIIICCLFFNIAGGFAFIQNNYEKCGSALIISSVFLTAALIFGIFKKVIPVIILNIIGSSGYIYTLAFLNAIPNSKVPRLNIEKLINNHIFTVFVTVLLFLLAFFNFMQAENISKRYEKKAAKKAASERKLTDEETIV